MRLWITVCLCLMGGHVVSTRRQSMAPAGISAVNRLFSHLMNSQYNRYVRPVADQSQTLVVKFSASLVEVLNLDSDSGQLTMNMWIRLVWKDSSLSWEPEQYDGIEQLHLPAKKVWLPDIMLYNGFDAKTDQDLDVVVSYDGTVVWVAPIIFKMTCGHEFRGNEWICPMRFGSWTYDGAQLDIRAFASRVKLSTSDYISGEHWEILSTDGARVEHFYECCNEPYPAMEYVLRMRDKTLGSISIG